MNLLSEERPFYSSKDSVGEYDKVDIVVGDVPSSPKFIKNRIPKPFSLPRDSFKNRLRPERQFDVSDVLTLSKGPQPSQRSGISFSKLTEDSNKRLSGKLASDQTVFDSLSSFYPQSSKWPARLSSKGTEENKFEAQNTSSPSALTSNPVAKPIENENIELLEVLFTKLKDTLETLKKKEYKNRKNITNLLNQSNDRSSGSEMTDPEIIYVNIWNNVNGELQLAERKHMSRKKFDEIDSTKDFSQLINFNNERNALFNSPTQKSHFSKDHSIQVINKITFLNTYISLLVGIFTIYAILFLTGGWR